MKILFGGKYIDMTILFGGKYIDMKNFSIMILFYELF